jgi:hypothetical protein
MVNSSKKLGGRFGSRHFFGFRCSLHGRTNQPLHLDGFLCERTKDEDKGSGKSSSLLNTLERLICHDV